MDKLKSVDIPKLESKTCHYCKKECEATICLYCNGKHTAKRIHERVEVERTIYVNRKQIEYFRKEKVKAKLIARDILGLEGLNQEERAEFFNGFNTEYNKLDL